MSFRGKPCRVPNGFRLHALLASGVSLAAVGAHAQDGPVADAGSGASDESVCAPGELSCTIGARVIYKPGYFTQFNPITALDMVARVPGFSVDGGDDVRGFGGAAGNVLIDGQRPSTKSASLDEILTRIGAGSVAYIELIRGGTGGLDVAGQAVVVNVIRKEGVREPSPWEFSLVQRVPQGGIRPRGEIFYSGRLRGTKYTIGAQLFGISLRSVGAEAITRFDDDDEQRTRDGTFRAAGGAGSLKLEHSFANGDIARFNVETEYFTRRSTTLETRFLQTGGPDLALFSRPNDEFEYEIGADYEHAFSNNFGVKVIGLFSRTINDTENGFEFTPAIGASDQSLFLSDQTEGETIGRAEFDWKGWQGHSIQFGGEIAQNFIDSEATLLVDDGAGNLVQEDINGVNTRVSELRGEVFLNDSWALSPNLKLDAGFAFEVSRIAQSGDNANSRFFVYPKPSLTLTYSPTSVSQWRFSAEREVGQLSFGDFVSSVNFDDEDVDFGNPDLQPQRSWTVETSFERRFGAIGVVEITGFFNYIQDVEDLLPLDGIVEVAGNIGDGQIYGGRIDLTAPLDWIGLSNSRVEASFTERRSSVTDPVTGQDRSFSFQPDRLYEVEFRQDVPNYKFSWGWNISDNSEEFGFGLDEITRFDLNPEIGAFIETTWIKGIKARVDIDDITNSTRFRERDVFNGSRVFNDPSFNEFRTLNNGGNLRFSLSGTF